LGVPIPASQKFGLSVETKLDKSRLQHEAGGLTGISKEAESIVESNKYHKA
jgi:hypothetical protein